MEFPRILHTIAIHFGLNGIDHGHVQNSHLSRAAKPNIPRTGVNLKTIILLTNYKSYNQKWAKFIFFKFIIELYEFIQNPFTPGFATSRHSAACQIRDPIRISIP